MRLGLQEVCFGENKLVEEFCVCHLLMLQPISWRIVCVISSLNVMIKLVEELCVSSLNVMIKLVEELCVSSLKVTTN
jgi:hypothetical protein